MYIYTFKNLMQFSGLNHQMIVLWNKKYKIFREEKIDRDSVFNKFDLKKLILVSFLVESNKKHSVEKLCAQSLSELQVLSEFEVQVFLKRSKDYTPIIRLMICSCFSYDEKSFGSILSICFKKLGIEKCCGDILSPLIEELSIIVQTHSIEDSIKSFTRNLIRNHLNYYLILSSHDRVLNDRRWLLFLPDGEVNDIELLFAHLILKLKGESGIYLGVNEQLHTVQECLESVKVTHVITFVSKDYDKAKLIAYLKLIKELSPEIIIFVATYDKLTEKITDDVPYINVNDVDMFKNYLNKMIDM